MALPIAPVALIWLRYAACLALILAVSRKRQRRDDLEDRAMDAVAPGLDVSRDSDRLRASGKWRWRLPIRADRPALELEASFLGRVRLRRV